MEPAWTTTAARAAKPGRLCAALLAWALLSAPTASAWADSDGERAALARLAAEIDALEPLVHEAERQADAADRRRFAYDLLQADLKKIKDGIREHLDRPREPKPPAPLAGEYRRP